MTQESYKKFRPQEFEGLLGQPDAVKLLTTAVANKRVPHCLMFTGPSGTGKTSAARILSVKIGCGASLPPDKRTTSHNTDYNEVNCAEARGIDDIRAIQQRLSLSPSTGRCRVYLLDECQKLTSDSQSCLLKTLEDTPRHIYFILATTDPQKLLKTIRTRASEVKFGPIPTATLLKLLHNTIDAGNGSWPVISGDVLDKIAAGAEGSARAALQTLDKLQGVTDATQQLSIIATGQDSPGAIAIARALYNAKTGWGEIARLLKETEEDHEGIRRCVLGYAAAILLNGKPDKRAGIIVDEFSKGFYDSLKPGLVGACFQVWSSGNK